MASMTTVKDELNTNISPRPPFDHHRDIESNDTKPNIEELSPPNAQNVLSFKFSPVPVICVKNMAIENTNEPHSQTISEKEVGEPNHVSRIIQSLQLVKAESCDDFVPKHSVKKETDSHIMTEYYNESVPMQSVGEVGHLDIQTENSDKFHLVQPGQAVDHLELKLKAELSYDGPVPMQSQIEIEVDHVDIKMEYCDELVPRHSGEQVGHMDTIKEHSESDELVSRHSYSEKEVGQLDIKQEYCDELVLTQSESEASPLEIKTECSNGIVQEPLPGQSQGEESHLDHVKTKCSDELNKSCSGGSCTKERIRLLIQKRQAQPKQTETEKCSEGVYPCPLCKSVLSSEHRLEIHTRCLHRRKQHGLSTSQGTNLCGSENSQKDGGFTTCSQCGEAFCRERGLAMMGGTTERDTLKCKKCTDSSVEQAKFDKGGHIEASSTHSDGNNKSGQWKARAGEKTFMSTPMKECGQTLSDSRDIPKYVKTDAGAKRYQCMECRKTFKKRCEVQAHMRTHSDERPFQCGECGMTFRQKAHLCSHMRRHTEEKPYECEECGKTFSHCGTLYSHAKLHTKEKPFKCSECGKTFRRSSEVYSHMRTHTGEKPYKCTECGKGFRQISHLRSHIRTHTGERPFKCTECGVAFNHSGHLHSHMKRHAGAKLFQCSECHKTFTRKSSWHKHMSIHARGNLQHHRIGECPTEAFTREKSLHNKHVRTPAEEKPHRCPECSQTFTRIESLQAHLRLHALKKAFK